MEVTGIDGLLASLAPAQTTTATKRNDELNRTDFLNLLIAQLQNQDPLNPLESADFSAQLAQFSSLEQLMQINQKLSEDADPASPTAAPGALDFLGREIAFASEELVVTDGTAPTFEVVLDTPSEVAVEILDQGGQPVASLSAGRFGAGWGTIDLSALGAADLAEGTYRLRVVATDDGGTAKEVSPIFRGSVGGVDLAGAPVLLVGERRIGVADVREIRSPGASRDGTSAAEDDQATEGTSGA